jgi:two-component system chemotaxis response regulator CheB
MNAEPRAVDERGGAELGVLVADDSPVARRLLVHILDADPALRVASEAADGAEAVRLAERVRPAVIVMDVRMPLLDGLQATRRIMETRPTPIVLVSADYDARDMTRSFEALQAGALTILGKPPGPQDPSFAERATALTTAVKLMADVKLVRRRAAGPTPPRPRPVPPGPSPTTGRRQVAIAAIAASTGGPAALATVLGTLPAGTPVPILVVQHIAAGFHQGLVNWLDSVCPLAVALARDGQPLRAGEVLIAPADAHLGVTTQGRVTLSSGPPIGAHRPSATHLFRSVARAYAAAAVGVVLTGMGDDGVAGLRALKDAGGLVLAQDETTSVVYGMPGEAAASGVVDQVLPLTRIAGALASAWKAAGP